MRSAPLARAFFGATALIVGFGLVLQLALVVATGSGAMALDRRLGRRWPSAGGVRSQSA